MDRLSLLGDALADSARGRVAGRVVEDLGGSSSPTGSLNASPVVEFATETVKLSSSFLQESETSRPSLARWASSLERRSAHELFVFGKTLD
jgi:hypothetical protein